MRVIAGSAKGRHLKSPNSPKTRPIIDRVKTALFDVLGDTVIDATVLDLFGGVGSVGIEALSRGARHATFVELDGGIVAILRENLRLTHVMDRAEVIQGDAFRYLQSAAAAHQHFTLIYIAPPQYYQLAAKALQQLDEAPLTTPGDRIIVQIDPRERLDLTTLLPHHFLLRDERKYGNTLLLFYEHRPA
jgi:16S rRNA (guanine966-N2)-methyltransferase